VATVEGWDIVCPNPMGSAISSYADVSISYGTKSFRSIVINASMILGVLRTPCFFNCAVSSFMPKVYHLLYTFFMFVGEGFCVKILVYLNKLNIFHTTHVTPSK